MITFERRKHRNLFNGDTAFLFASPTVYNPKGGPYTAEILHRYVDLLADNGVDTFLINATAQVPWYPSKRTPNLFTGYRRGDREFFRKHYPPFDKDWTAEMLERRLDEDVEFFNRYLDLADAGVNWVAELAKGCRRRGVSPWVSCRMNDLHGASNWEGSYLNGPLLSQKKFRLRGQPINPGEGANPYLEAINYEHQEVRDFYFAMIREVVEDHDFEGIELDWLRCSFCCEPPATASTIDNMTEWFAEIRALTQRQANKTGRPYPLGLRLPARLGALHDIGIDVKRLVKENIIDFVGFSNYWQTSWDVPFDQIRQDLGEEVAMYGVIDDAPNWMFAHDPKSGKKYYRLLSSSAELLRGNAAGKLALGVDGIETYNFFCSDEVHHNLGSRVSRANYPALRGLEQLENLRGKPKHYALATMHGFWMFQPFEYAEQVPVILEPDWRRAFRLSMCAESSSADLELIIQLVVEKKDRLPPLGVSFNGFWPNFSARPTNELLFPTGIYTHHIAEHQALNYRFKASEIREGWNEILVFNENHQRSTLEERRENSVCIVNVELAVKQPSA